MGRGGAGQFVVGADDPHLAEDHQQTKKALPKQGFVGKTNF